MKVGYGPAAEWMDFDRIVKIIRDAEDPEGEAYRYFLNRPRAPRRSGSAPDAIARVIAEFKVKKRGESMIAARLRRLREGRPHRALGLHRGGDLFPIGIWIPPTRPAGERRHAAVDWTFENFDVVRFYGDPPWWQDQMGAWAEKHNSRRRSPRSAGHRVLDERRLEDGGRLRRAADGGQRRHARSTRSRCGRRDPRRRAGRPRERRHALAQWHFENARKRKVKLKLEDHAEEAFVVRKERPMSPLKIDSVPAPRSRSAPGTTP
jgi:hypothetical protein